MNGNLSDRDIRGHVAAVLGATWPHLDGNQQVTAQAAADLVGQMLVDLNRIACALEDIALSIGK